MPLRLRYCSQVDSRLVFVSLIEWIDSGFLPIDIPLTMMTDDALVSVTMCTIMSLQFDVFIRCVADFTFCFVLCVGRAMAAHDDSEPTRRRRRNLFRNAIKI